MMYKFIYLRIILSELKRQKRLNMLPEKMVAYCSLKLFIFNDNIFKDPSATAVDEDGGYVTIVLPL